MPIGNASHALFTALVFSSHREASIPARALAPLIRSASAALNTTNGSSAISDSLMSTHKVDTLTQL